jgi:hypothetical protein
MEVSLLLLLRAVGRPKGSRRTIDVGGLSRLEGDRRRRGEARVVGRRRGRDFERDRDLALLGRAGEADRVRQQVDDDLAEPDGVGKENVVAVGLAQLATEVERDADAFEPGLARKDAEQLPDLGREVAWRRKNVERRKLDLAERQKVVGDALDQEGRLGDIVERLDVLLEQIDELGRRPEGRRARERVVQLRLEERQVGPAEAGALQDGRDGVSNLQTTGEKGDAVSAASGSSKGPLNR